jgi:hypothetical protein
LATSGDFQMAIDIQLSYEVVLTVREEMPIEVVGSPDVGVAHAAHHLERVRAFVNHERAAVWRSSWKVKTSDPHASVAGVQERVRKLSPRRNPPLGAGKTQFAFE